LRGGRASIGIIGASHAHCAGLVRDRWGELAELGFGQFSQMLPPCCQNRHWIECNAMKSKKHGNSQGTEYPLQPIIGSSGCLGHIRTTCHGYQAFDRQDRLLGVFVSPGESCGRSGINVRG
jgi:hypothetical protein